MSLTQFTEISAIDISSLVEDLAVVFGCQVILTPKNDSQILHQRTDIDGGNFGKLCQRHVEPMEK
jgi:hypothetical protein